MFLVTALRLSAKLKIDRNRQLAINCATLRQVTTQRRDYCTLRLD